MPSINKGMGEHFLQPFLRFFRCPSLIWTKWALPAGCFSKVLWKTYVLHKNKFKFLCNVFFYRFFWFRWAVNLVTLINSKTAVGNIITLLHSFWRSEGALQAVYESLKAWHQTVFVVGTAKAYFPDRQSCSTLCRQPSGCARSVEIVAVYPSLGSYSIVSLFRWASPPFKNALHSIRKKVGVKLLLFSKLLWEICFFDY